MSYTPILTWSEYKDSNLGPPGPKPGALPDCATLRNMDGLLTQMTLNELLIVIFHTIRVTGAGCRIRTDHIRLTRAALYQMS